MTPLDDDPGNRLELVGIAQQLTWLQPAIVAEIVVLDPRHCHSAVVGGEVGEHCRVGKQGDGKALPH